MKETCSLQIHQKAIQRAMPAGLDLGFQTEVSLHKTLTDHRLHGALGGWLKRMTEITI